MNQAKDYLNSCLPRRLSFFLIAVMLGNLALFSLKLSAEELKDFDTNFNIANLNYRQGKYDEAIKYYKKANSLAEQPDMECLWGLAQAYQKIKAYKDVLIYCDQIIQMQNIESNFLARVLNLKGEAFYSSALLMAYPKKETAKLYAAESAFREALKNNPYLALAHYNLGLTLVYLDKVDEGIGELSLYVSKVDPATAEKVKKLIDNPQRIVENFAPEFSSVTSDGSYITLDELRGKVLLLDFWGTWCGPCIAALPSLMKVAKNFSKEDFMLISIDTGDERAQWLDFITKNKMNWTQLFDENSKIRNAFKINSFPSYILIDHEGIIRYQTKGYSDRKENEIISAVKNCLKSRDKSSSRAKPVKAEEKSGMKSN